MDGLDDLFGKSVYLAWLPGETLFSLISRHHFFWGHPLSSRTCMQFYGHARAGSQHDFPSRLARFEELTQARYGYAETIAGQHTLLAYYAPFLKKSDFRNAIATMSSDNVSHLKFRLGILTSRFRANHPLKACPACIQEDRVVFGWAYWHMDHQYPGVWICLKHGQLLRESMLKATGVERFQWHLPTEDQFRKVATESLTAIHNVLPELRSLSWLVLGLVTPGSEFTIDTSHLHELYKSEMARRGWLTKGGSCRMPEIAARFLEFVQPFRTLPELSTLPSNVTESATQLRRLLRPPRSGTHPLRHLLLIHWFFGTAGTFLSEYSKLLTQTVNVFNKESACICDVGDEQPDPRHAQLFNLVSTQNLSMRMAAKTLGVDVGTAMAWAAKAGLSASRRPKKLTVEIRKQAILELQKGYDKIVVARNANVSPVTITKLLFSEVGLQIAWRSARSLDAQTSARQKW